MGLGWGGFDRAKLNMLILIRIPFSFHVYSCFTRWSHTLVGTKIKFTFNCSAPVCVHICMCVSCITIQPQLAGHVALLHVDSSR